MPAPSDTWKVAAFAAISGALATAYGCSFAYDAEVKDAQSWRAHQSYETACVKHIAPGLSYDPCAIKTERNVTRALAEAKRCVETVGKGYDIDAIDRLCRITPDDP